MSGPVEWAFSWVWAKVFAFSPKISRDVRKLIARSCWRSQLFTFGFAGRKVIVDPNRKLVIIRTRTFWFVRKVRFIPFDAIQEIIYTYNDIDPVGEWAYSHQTNDLFVIGLKLEKAERVLLFRFYGTGDFSNNSDLPDWMFLGDQIESKLTMQNQEGESRAYADALSRVIGVPVGGDN